MRDLDGYMGPAETGTGKERKTRWVVGEVSISHSLGAGDCQCPCNLAHPGLLPGGCPDGLPIAATAITHKLGSSFYPVYLCAACAAVQLSMMNRGLRVITVSRSDAKARLVGAVLAAALFIGVAWYFGGGAIAWAVGLGILAGITIGEKS